MSSSIEVDRKVVFNLIRAKCVEISQVALVPKSSFDPYSKRLTRLLEDLLDSLRSVEQPYLIFNGSFADYIFFPISHLLRQQEQLGDRNKELVLQIIDFLVRYGWSNGDALTLELSQQLLILVNLLIGAAGIDAGAVSTDGTPLQTSSSTVYAGMLTVLSLIQAIDSHPKLASSFVQNLVIVPSMGQTIVVLLDCVKTEVSNVDLQLCALKSIEILYGSIIKDGDILASVLPGTVSTLSNVLSNKKDRCHYKVAVAIMNVLTTSLSLTFNDSDLEQETLQSSSRNSAWLKATKEQIKISLVSLVPYRSKSRIEVKVALSDLCLKLLYTSRKSLDNCLFFFVDFLIYLLPYDYDNTDHPLDINSRLLKALESYADVRECLSDRIYEWIDSLPRGFSSHDQDQTILTITAISDGLRLLSESQLDDTDNLSFLRETLMNNLSKSITFTRTLKSSSAKASQIVSLSTPLLQHNTVSTSLNQTDVGFPSSGSQISLSTSVQTRLESLLNLLGTQKGGNSLLETLNIEFNEAKDMSSKISSFWMSVSLLDGIVEGNTSSLSDPVDDWIQIDDQQVISLDQADQIYEILLSCKHILRAASSDLRSNGFINDFGSQSDPSLTCLGLKGVGTLSRIIGKNFRSELMDLLYPVVHLVGSYDPIVSRWAQWTLLTFTKSCEYVSVKDLLTQNIDYLIDNLSLKLNTLDISPQGPVILKTLIKYTGSSITKYLDDVIATLFVILDNYHGYAQLTNGIFDVLLSIVEEVSQNFDSNHVLSLQSTEYVADSIKSSSPHLTSIQDLLNAFSTSKEDLKEDYDLDESGHPSRPFAEESNDRHEEQEEYDEDRHDVDENEQSMDNEDESEKQAWTSPIDKPTYHLVEKVATYSDKYLIHDSVSLKANLLDLVIVSIPLLATSPDNFYPFINTVWPVLLSRLNDTETHILEKCLKIIGLLCQYGNDFMTSRIVSAWPKLQSFGPHKTTFKNEPKYSREYRISKEFFSALRLIVQYTRLPDNMLDSIVEVTDQFLELQPELKEALASRRPDLIRFHDIITHSMNLQVPVSPPGQKYPFQPLNIEI